VDRNSLPLQSERFKIEDATELGCYQVNPIGENLEVSCNVQVSLLGTPLDQLLQEALEHTFPINCRAIFKIYNATNLP
jgi:hypothetical protein